MVNLEMFTNKTLHVLLSLHYLPNEDSQFTALSTIWLMHALMWIQKKPKQQLSSDLCWLL